MTKIKNSKGTILIWTVLLGVMMTSVFFFLAMRLSGMGAIQRDSMEYQNLKAYMESCVGYFMSLPAIDLMADTDLIGCEDITGMITNQVEEITGVLDADGSVTYNFGGLINVEWNLCSDNYGEDILIDGVEYEHGPTSLCPGYYDKAEAILVANPFTIKTKGAPIYYKITPVASTQLVDNRWQIHAEMDLGYRDKIVIDETFIPKP
jgi:hypothetical protein